MTSSVLVTDDDDGLRQLLRMVLERADGFQVVGEAHDATSCLLAVTELQPDVLLLDVGLPGRSGLEIAREVRELAPNTLVVVLSAHPADRMADQALVAGAHAYLSKDDLVRGLVPALTDALRSRAARAIPPAGPVGAAAAAWERFAATAAHDLRRALLGVTAHADLLIRTPGVAQDPEATGLVRDLSDSARAGLLLVDDLQAYADVAARPDLAEPVDLSGLVLGLLRRWPASSIEVGDLGTAHADPVLLRHLVGQLLDNAVRHAPEGRAVLVRVSATADAGLVVEDDGDGIAPAERERVLEEFERGASTVPGTVPGTAPGTVPGTGLGLAICSLVAQRYGGRLTVRDAAGGGARIEVTLPRAGLSGGATSAPLG